MAKKEMCVMNVSGLLEGYPLAIALRESLQRVADVESAILESESRMGIIEAAMSEAVLGATNGDGKPVYSNEQARKAAIAKAIAEDEQVMTMAIELRESRKSRSYALADAEALKNAIRLACATANVGGEFNA